MKRGPIRAALVGLLAFGASVFGVGQEWDHENFNIIGSVLYNFIGCSDGNEVPAVLGDYGVIREGTHDGALALRSCMFVKENDLVDLIRPGEDVVLEGRPVSGYFVDVLGVSRSFEPVWFPMSFIKVVRVEPKHQELMVNEPQGSVDLIGGLPVGRWSVWEEFPSKRYESSRTGFHHFVDEWEIRHSGRGSVLEYHGPDARPEGGFIISERPSGVWTRKEQIAWKWREQTDEDFGYLLITDTYVQTAYGMFHVEDDLLVTAKMIIDRDGNVTHEGYRPMHLIVRIGTELDRKLVDFMACVEGNAGKPLYDVVKCEYPFVDEDGELYSWVNW